MISLARIRQKDPDLAVFNASCCPTVLSLHSHGLLPLLEKARFINDQHPIGTGNHLTYIGLELISYLIAVPHRSVEQILHRIWRRQSCLFCQLPSIFAFDWAEQSSQIGFDSFSGLRACKTGANALAEALEQVRPHLFGGREG